MNLTKAKINDLPRVWEIIAQAIQKRKAEQSTQWQNGYPNETILKQDIEKGYAYVARINELIVGYIAVIYDGEPAYDSIDGKWLSDRPFAVLHRLAVAQDIAINGVGTLIMKAVEKQVLYDGFQSIRVDTNFDNMSMLRVFEKRGYTYCGEVMIQGAKRKAFEKALV